jgi:hypothetical protein
MSVVFLAVGTTRARAVLDAAAFLLERGVEVSLITSSAVPWTREGIDPRVRILTLETPLDRRLLAAGPVGKVYRLVRPYALWRSARRRAIGAFDWATVEQAVVFDSHAIPIGWHLARRRPDLAVGFELDREPYQGREPAAVPAAASPIPTIPEQA